MKSSFPHPLTGGFSVSTFFPVREESRFRSVLDESKFVESQ